jgi:thiol-disulfide isomerase/thioredoxin
MHKIIALLALTTTLLMAELNWTRSYDTALEQAQKENKLVMVMLTREGCPACEYMKDIVFEDDNVMTEVEMGFVPVEIDIEAQLVPSGLGYIGTPTFHFLKPDETKVARQDGGANVKDFTDKLREAKREARQ